MHDGDTPPLPSACEGGGAQEEGRDRPPANGEQTRHKYATPIQCDTSNHLQCYWDIYYLFIFTRRDFFCLVCLPKIDKTNFHSMKLNENDKRVLTSPYIYVGFVNVLFFPLKEYYVM